MSDEIKEILDKAKEISGYGSDGKQHTRMFNQFETKALLDYITNLQEKNNNLKEDFKRHIDRINELTERNDNLQEKNERLNNIINELEKDTIELMKSYKDVNAPRYDMCKHFIYKLKELKENK